MCSGCSRQFCLCAYANFSVFLENPQIVQLEEDQSNLRTELAGQRGELDLREKQVCTSVAFVHWQYMYCQETLQF